jgi:predicted RNA-binding protein YlqC (UPF0109 family)
MREFVQYAVRALVDHPDRVQVAETERSGALVLELSVDPSDFGKVIGKQGRVCAAIRALLNCASGKLGRRVVLNILEPPGERPAVEHESPAEGRDS